MAATFVKSVTFDCTDALVVARFWAAALGSTVAETSTSAKAFVEAPGWGGPQAFRFARVPSRKVPRTRMHFDLRAAGSVEAEVERLVGLGATMVPVGEESVVLQDPEGNEFCVED